MTTTLATLATVNGVADRISQDGIDLRVDDVPPDEMGNVLALADQEVYWYLLEQYSDTVLATSDLVMGWADDAATLFLCERRGNAPPAGTVTRWERTREKLEQVQLGRRKIPRLPRRKGNAPVLSNLRPTLRPMPRVVVEKNRSTGTPADYTQTTDPWDQLNTSWWNYVI